MKFSEIINTRLSLIIPDWMDCLILSIVEHILVKCFPHLSHQFFPNLKTAKCTLHVLNMSINVNPLHSTLSVCFLHHAPYLDLQQLCDSDCVIFPLKILKDNFLSSQTSFLRKFCVMICFIFIRSHLVFETKRLGVKG